MKNDLNMSCEILRDNCDHISSLNRLLDTSVIDLMKILCWHHAYCYFFNNVFFNTDLDVFDLVSCLFFIQTIDEQINVGSRCELLVIVLSIDRVQQNATVLD